MSNQRFSVAFLLKSQWTYLILFGILGLLGSINHSMWRDEMNVWLIAKYSHNLADFWNNIRYDRGHPGLWHTLVAIAFHFVDNPLVMQLLHWLIGFSGVLLLWIFAPFSQKQKILFSFGYLPFFENLLISRNYGLGMLLLFGICTIFPARNKTYLGLAGLLSLLANSNIYGLLIAVAIALALILELWLNPLQRKQFLQQSSTLLRLSPWRDILVSTGIFLFSCLVAGYTIFPPVTTGEVLTDISAESKLEQFLISLGRMLGGYTLLIPNPSRLLDLLVCGIIAAIILLIFLTSLAKKPIPLFFFSFSTFLLLLFSYVSFPGRGPRHYGHFYLILIAALWLSRYYQPQKWLPSNFTIPEKRWLKKTQISTLMFVLYIQFFGGLFGFIQDIIIPFSASHQVANYIQANNLQNEFIVGSRDVNMAGISGYLGRELYYPERRNLGSFSLFLKQKRDELDQNQMLSRVAELFTQNAKFKRILLILHKELETASSDLQIVPIKKFERSWKDSEQFYLYWVSSDTDT